MLAAMPSLLLSAVAALQSAPPPPGMPPPPPPPPMSMAAAMPSDTPPEMALIDYEASEVRCRGVIEKPVFAARPLPTSGFIHKERPAPAYQVAFRIAPDGRPLGVSRPNRVEGAFSFVDSDDLAPALAAWRFAPGGERPGCVATFTPRAVAVEDAPQEMLHRYVALPHGSGLARAAVAKRLRDEAPGCFSPTPPKVLLQGYPDFDALPQPPGTFSYSMVGFDIDARGVPTKVRMLSSDGNAALDRAAVAAIAKSRFKAEPRTGCHYPYHRRQALPVQPPPPPERESFVQPGATCDNKIPWAKTPVLVFPEPFRRRPFEGWAVVRYDVAPWGATGKIEVLASEPAQAFGEQAKQVIAAATRAPSETGAVGCVDRVIFKLPESGDAPSTRSTG